MTAKLVPMFETEALRKWFIQQKRDLPWRENSSPYAVLVSEIMLQQTQVAVVIPYFLRWMAKFPSFEALAACSEEEVMKYWEGLGYYSRAKNLRKAALVICSQWKGTMPENPEAIAQIPGVGPYTLGAIRAFAFKHKTAAVDGNVMRVLSRYFSYYEDICKAKSQKYIRDVAEKILPEKAPWEIAEALIELGALVCKKVPLCSNCPLKNTCQAFKNNTTHELPVKLNKIASIKLHRTVFVLMHQENVLIRKVPDGEIMAGLHEFPYFENDESGCDMETLQEKIKEKFGLNTTPLRRFPAVQHGFTRYRAVLEPVLLQAHDNSAIEDYFWISLEERQELAFSSGHRRILKLLS